MFTVPNLLIMRLTLNRVIIDQIWHVHILASARSHTRNLIKVRWGGERGRQHGGEAAAGG